VAATNRTDSPALLQRLELGSLRPLPGLTAKQDSQAKGNSEGSECNGKQTVAQPWVSAVAAERHGEVSEQECDPEDPGRKPCPEVRLHPLTFGRQPGQHSQTVHRLSDDNRLPRCLLCDSEFHLARRCAGPIPEGTRNDSLFQLGVRLARWGGRWFTPERVEEYLVIENERRCAPPLDEREVRQIARSIRSSVFPRLRRSRPDYSW
jgi:hypothetical protein